MSVTTSQPEAVGFATWPGRPNPLEAASELVHGTTPIAEEREPLEAEWRREREDRARIGQ
jgi:hypothetical protein